MISLPLASFITLVGSTYVIEATGGQDQDRALDRAVEVSHNAERLQTLLLEARAQKILSAPAGEVRDGRLLVLRTQIEAASDRLVRSRADGRTALLIENVESYLIELETFAKRSRARNPRSRADILALEARRGELVDQLERIVENEERRLADGLQAVEDNRASAATYAVIVCLLIGVGGGVVAARLFAAGISSRIDVLRNNAARLIRGDELLPEAHAHDEIGALASDLERASQMLAKRQRELGEARTFLEHVVAVSPTVTLRGNPLDFGVHYVSPNSRRILGYEPDEIEGTAEVWLNRVHPDDRDLILERTAKALQDSSITPEIEFRFRHKEGRYLTVRSTARIDYDESGQPTDILVFLTDITDLRRAEAAVVAALQEVEQASEAKSEFLSRMSHDLRTPLNAILGFAQLLKMDALDEEQVESLDQIENAGRRLVVMVNEVLDMSKIEAGQVGLSLEPVELSRAIQETLGLMRPLAKERKISLSGDCAAGRFVRADQQKLHQILVNLVSNAVKYTPVGGRAEIRSSFSDDRVRVEVADSGPGIPKDKIATLFDPFTRLGVEETAVEGTGLGLAIAKRFVQAMGGDIGVYNGPTGGATFWFELETVDAPTMADEAGAGPLESHSGLKDKSILYIEDNQANLDLVSRMVSSRLGMRFLSATEGREGIEAAREHHPDVILLDMNLPDIHGEEVLRFLRGDKELSTLPVVVLSADSDPKLIERVRAAGALDYLTKPLDISVFVRALNLALTAE